MSVGDRLGAMEEEKLVPLCPQCNERELEVEYEDEAGYGIAWCACGFEQPL
jgi:hypothetical protein